MSNRDDLEAAPSVPIPERFEVLLHDGELRVRWRWFRAKEHLGLLLFCFVWDGALIAMFATKFLDGMLSWSQLFMIGHFAVGVGLTYYLLAGLFNRTTVSAVPGRLTIKHEPIPWRGNRELTRAEIRQLYVGEHTTENDGVTTTRYELCAVLDGDRQVELVRGLDELAQARYLEDAFELHFKIKDRWIPDEVPKRARRPQR